MLGVYKPLMSLAVRDDVKFQRAMRGHSGKRSNEAKVRVVGNKVCASTLRPLSDQQIGQSGGRTKILKHAPRINV